MKDGRLFAPCSKLVFEQRPILVSEANSDASPKLQKRMFSVTRSPVVFVTAWFPRGLRHREDRYQVTLKCDYADASLRDKKDELGSLSRAERPREGLLLFINP